MGMFDTALNGIIAAAEARRASEPGHADDYPDADGLLMCGKCHTRKQKVLDIPCGIGLRVVPVMCRCECIAREEEEARKKAQEEQERIEKLRRVGITTEKYRYMTMAMDDGGDQKMRSIAERYVAKRADMFRENIGLMLHGDTGGGKTFWAAAITNAMIDNGMSAMITTIPQLITAMSKDFEANKYEVLDKIARVGFLVLDDIGFERQTSYAAEKMYEIIDTRYQARRPLIITTNLSLEEITNPQQMEYKRVFDRIVEMCQPVHVKADGRRKAIARQKSERAREILGL